jgi:hypothetical protein
MKQRLLLLVVGLVALGTGVHFARYYILDRAPVVTLQKGALASTVSQSLTNSPDNVAPVIGKNYTIQSVTYFDNDAWAVVRINPVNNYASPAVIVLHLQNGSYKTILGPGSSFPSSSAQNVPTTVLYYLNSHKLTTNEIAD